MQLKNKNSKGGFTLIEVMIAITLFTVIMIIGTGAVLKTNVVHKKTQTMRSVMDNLNFIMEDMARNLRLGYNYQCPSSFFPSTTPTTIPTPLATKSDSDCLDSKSIAFESVDGSVIIYTIGSNPNAVYKAKKDGALLPITPAEVQIDPLSSGFTVVGALPVSLGDMVQPRVIIRLSGTVSIPGKNIITDFNLETTVSQRLLDI